MRAHLELFAALLVDVRRAVHRELLDAGRQRNRTADLGAGALGRVHDLARRRIEDAVIERLEPDPDVLAVHLSLSSPFVPANAGTQWPQAQISMQLWAPACAGANGATTYSMMLA